MTDAGWTSSATVEQIASWLGGLGHVAVLTHVKPDGDAVGSTLACVRALRSRGIETDLLYAGPMPQWIDDLAGSTAYRTIAGPDDLSGFTADGAVVFDTGAWSQLDAFEGLLRPRRSDVAVIDHHLQGDPSVGERRVVDPSAAAACVTTAELCRLLLGLERVSALPREIAEPLYLGIATDTGWFRHSNVKPRTMRMAADLIEAGAEHARLYGLIEQRQRLSRLRMMARALSSLEMHKGGRVAIMTLRRGDFEACQAISGDTGGFGEMALAVDSVRVAAVLTEAWGEGGQALTKISLRSKPGPDAVDVNVVARSFGGGGHAQAAGARLQADIATAKRRLLEALG